MYDDDMPMATEEVLRALSEMVAVVMVDDTGGDADELNKIVLAFGHMLVASLGEILIKPEGETLN